MTLLRDARVTLKLKKRVLFKSSINYPGHVIWPRDFRTASHTFDAIRKLKSPTTVTELKSFFGARNVF